MRSNVKVKKDDMRSNVYKGTVWFLQNTKENILKLASDFSFFHLHSESWTQMTFIVWTKTVETFFRISSVCSTEEKFGMTRR